MRNKTWHTFCLAILAEERRVANDSVEGAFQLGRQSDGLGKVVPYELFEHGESFVVLEELELRLALVLARSLFALVSDEYREQV